MQAIQLSSARAVVASRAPLRQQASRPASTTLRRGMVLVRAWEDRESAQAAMEAEQLTTTALLVAAGLLGPLLLDANTAQAAVPALIKGRTFSLIHPGGFTQPDSTCGGGGVHARASVRTRAVQRRQLPGAASPVVGVGWLSLLGYPSCSNFPPTIFLPTTAAVLVAVMFFLFGSSVYAGYLGFQWRRTR
jgi:hypothetical protein